MKLCSRGASLMAISIDDLLRRAVETKASDLHLKVGNHPYFRVDGLLNSLSDVPRITPEEMLSMAFSMMTNRQKQKFKETAELDMAYGVAGLGRFRVNVFQQRGNVGMVLRVIPTKIKTIEELELPRVLTKICEEQRGMILVTGTTGSGKSTSLAAVIDRINSVFPPPEQKQIRLQLASTLRAVVSQRLVRRGDGAGRVPAVEVMITTGFIRDCIMNPDKTRSIRDAIAAGTSQYGMQTFDQSIYDLYSRGLITLEEALIRASNPDEFRLRIQGVRSTADAAREEMERAISDFDRSPR